MKKSTFLLCATFLLSCFTAQALTVDSVATITPALSGTEVYYACLVYHQNGGSKDANFMLMDGSISKEEISWSGSEVLVNFGSQGLNVNDGNDKVIKDTLAFNDGDEVHIWIALNVAAKTYDVYALNYTQGSEQKHVGENAAFRAQTATTLGQWAAVHNENSSGNTLEVKTVGVVANTSSYPTSYNTITTLQSLTVGTGTLSPAFSPDVTEYSLVLPKENKGTSVEVSAKATVPNAKVEGAGTINLTNGAATASIKVTGADGTSSTTYTINISTVATSNDATLKSITVNLGEDSYPLSGFTPEALNYTYSVPVDFKGVPTISAEKNSEYAQDPVITQATGVPGTATIVVTAEDKTTLTYTINFVVNLLAGWDGNGDTSAQSTPETYGWHSNGGNSFNVANGNGGARYMDPGNGEYSGYTFNEETYCSTRSLWLRWGVGGSSSASAKDYTYDIPVKLDGCTTYELKWKQAWHNNADRPDITVKIYAKDSTLLRSVTVPCTEKRQWVEGSLVFATSENTEGLYFGFVATINGGGAWGDVIVAFTDLQLAKYTGAPILEVSKTTQYLTKYTPEALRTIDLAALALTESLTITAPTGIQLALGEQSGSSLTIQPGDLACGGSGQKLVVSADSETAIEGEIIVASGASKDTIDVVYMVPGESKNLIALAMGSTDDSLKTVITPDYFGWQGMTLSNEWFAEPKENKDATWTASGVWGNRYDSVAGFVYGNDSIDSWGLILRWDGTGNTDSTTVFSYPFEVEEAGKYAFAGKHAWHSNSVGCFTAFGFNMQRDNASSAMLAGPSDTYWANNMIEYYDFTTAGRIWTDLKYEFEVETPGTYYLTFQAAPDVSFINADAQCIIVLKDLQITYEGQVALQTPWQDNVKVSVQDRYIRVIGTDDYRIYSVSGAEVNPQARQMQGAYIVTAGGRQFKVLVK